MRKDAHAITQKRRSDSSTRMVKIKMEPINVSNTSLSLYKGKRHRKFDAKQTKRHDFGTEVCAVCDKVFTKYHWRAMMCSEECKRLKTNARKRGYYKENPAKHIARKIAWKKANPEIHKATRLKYNANNREKIKAQNRKYREENLEKMKAYDRKYYEENREKKAAYDRKRHEENREKENAQRRARYHANKEK